MIRVDRKLNATDVPEALTGLFVPRGPLEYTRSGKSPELVARKVRDRITAAGARTDCIEPGPPREHGCCESFNARFRDERRDGEPFHRLREAHIPIEQ